MRYGDIAAELNGIAKQLTELADKLNEIEEATPTISIPERTMLSNKLAFTVAEAAQVLSLSKNLMYQLANRDDFPSIRLGKRIMIPRDKLIEWVNSHCGEQL